MEFKPLKDHINRRVLLNESESTEILSFFKLTKVKKRQMIIQPEFIAKYRNYVMEGSFRAYVVGENGMDHTIQLAIEDWWISDYNSYIYQQPGTMFVMALEDSIILQIDFQSEMMLKRKNHKFETFFRIMAERSTAFMQRRIISNLTKTAEERYSEFHQKYPQLIKRVPQYAIASFLGMTTEYFSKLRKKRVIKD